MTKTIIAWQTEVHYLEDIIHVLEMEKTSNKYIKPYEDRLVQIKEFIHIESKQDSYGFIY